MNSKTFAMLGDDVRNVRAQCYQRLGVTETMGDKPNVQYWLKMTTWVAFYESKFPSHIAAWTVLASELKSGFYTRCFLFCLFL